MCHNPLKYNAHGFGEKLHPNIQRTFLPNSNFWVVKGGHFLPKIYRDLYVTSKLAAKGNLKEVFMLHHGLCEIWHL